MRVCACACGCVHGRVCVLAGKGIGGSLRTIITFRRKSKTLDFFIKELTAATLLTLLI